MVAIGVQAEGVGEVVEVQLQVTGEAVEVGLLLEAEERQSLAWGPEETWHRGPPVSGWVSSWRPLRKR